MSKSKKEKKSIKRKKINISNAQKGKKQNSNRKRESSNKQSCMKKRVQKKTPASPIITKRNITSIDNAEKYRYICASSICQTLRRYYIEEYPNILINTKKRKSTCVKLSNPVKKFYMLRITEHWITTIMYLCMLLILISQMREIVLTGPLSSIETIYRFIVKAIGLALCICSFAAWCKQLCVSDEVYGIALSGISEYLTTSESISVIRKSFFSKKTTINIEDEKQSDNNNLLIADCIKNRPSVIFILILLCIVLWLPVHTPLLFVCHAILPFFLIVPLSDYLYWIYDRQQSKNERRKEKKVRLFSALSIGWLIVFGIPITVGLLTTHEIMFYTIIALAIVVYSRLLCIGHAIKKTIKNDIKEVKDKTAEWKNFSNSKKGNQKDITNVFVKLSFSGTKKVLLNALQNGITLTAETVRELQNMNSNSEIHEMIMELLHG